MEREKRTAIFKCSPICDDYWDLFNDWVKEQEIGGWIMVEHHADGYDRDTDLAWEEATFIKI